MKEEWRTIVLDGKEHFWYSVSNLGNVRSHLQTRSIGRQGFSTSYNPNFYKDLKFYTIKNRDGSVKSRRLSLFNFLRVSLKISSTEKKEILHQ